MSVVKLLIKTLHIIFFFLMIAIGILSILKPELIKVIIDGIGNIIGGLGAWNYVLLFIVAMIESFPFLGVVVPGMNIMILIGGFFVMRDSQTFFVASILGMAWATLGNALWYTLGRYMWKEVLEKYGIWFGIDTNTLPIIQKHIKKNGFWFIIGGKFHNLFRSFIPYIVGAQEFPQKHFWFANILGSFIWSVSILLIGVFFVANYENILQYISYIILGVIIISWIIYIKTQWTTRWKNTKA